MTNVAFGDIADIEKLRFVLLKSYLRVDAK